MLNKLHIFGKFLDQPLLISKLDKNVPKILSAITAVKIVNDTFETFEDNQKKSKKYKEQSYKKLFRNSFVLACSVFSAIKAPKIASYITKRTPIKPFEIVKNEATNLIDNFVVNKNIDKENLKILNKAKTNILSLSEVKKLTSTFNDENGKKFINRLIPEPENIQAKDIFSEIGYLSIYGAVPVVGGITSGVCADIITNNNYKENLPDKVSEGLYQYLANIFLCNVGAGAALGILEKFNIKSKSLRAIGMALGIIATGVVGGSKIANLISKKIINPLILKGKKKKERKPEALDLCMHTDDIATVSVLSGLKWIEPSLPTLYAISGYRAGIGYRN